ncbi:MAG: hypothetical protein IJ518_06630 [Clostridia bacterium]|nr:hypothetical protein [Clostridia bacterium]
MKKKQLLFHVAYYILSLFIYIGFIFASTKFFHTSNLGAAIAIAYGLMFLATPILIAVLMRFSLFKWYVDPLAAAEVPLILYIGMIINQMNQSGIHVYDAFLETNKVLCADEKTGWFFLIGLFLFGLVASFSFARKKGESISYRLISKFIT